MIRVKTLNIFGKPKSLWKLKSLWLLQNAILTKDNLTRRNWKGSEIYAFYTEKESVEHLFLWMDGGEIHLESDCCTLGVSCRPCNIDQLVWIKLCLPNGKPVYVVGLAALCQAIWCTRHVCFEDKRTKSPSKIIYMMCSFLDYWAGLQKTDMERQMKQGAESWRQQRSTSRRKSRRKATKMTDNSSFIALGDHLLHKIRPWFALTISHAWKSFRPHTN